MKILTLSSAIALSTFLTTSPTSHASTPMEEGSSTSHARPAMSEQDAIKLAKYSSLIDQLEADLNQKDDSQKSFKDVVTTKGTAAEILKYLTDYKAHTQEGANYAAINHFIGKIKDLDIVVEPFEKSLQSNFTLLGIHFHQVMEAVNLIDKHGTKEQKAILHVLNKDGEILEMAHKHFGFSIDPTKIDALKKYDELRELILKFIKEVDAVQ